MPPIKIHARKCFCLSIMYKRTVGKLTTSGGLKFSLRDNKNIDSMFARQTKRKKKKKLWGKKKKKNGRIPKVILVFVREFNRFNAKAKHLHLVAQFTVFSSMHDIGVRKTIDVSGRQLVAIQSIGMSWAIEKLCTQEPSSIFWGENMHLGREKDRNSLLEFAFYSADSPLKRSLKTLKVKKVEISILWRGVWLLESTGQISGLKCWFFDSVWVEKWGEEALWPPTELLH